MLTDQHYKELDKNGYTVVPGVVSSEECDAAIRQYREWLTQFKDGSWPRSFNSILHSYNSGHMIPTWELRLKTKKVFAQLWKTDKLLTSFDAIAVGRPPEDGKEHFDDPRKRWIHTDQNASRLGLHAYQGALYLAEQCKDDWTLQVLEGSHKCHETFFSHHPQAAEMCETAGHYTLSPDDLEFYKEAGYHRMVRMAVLKGGMAFWDSRLVHASGRPLKGRKHPGRWRFTNFISMTPAIWASKEDIKCHQKAYEKAKMTSHWSSTRLKLCDFGGRADIDFPAEVPACAQTDEAKRLSGVLPYDFEDGQPNGDEYIPKWKI